MTSLTLPESLLLLSLQDETGARKGTFIPYALAGAGLAELILRGVIEAVPDKKHGFTVARTDATGDAYLDACLDYIRTKKQPGSAKSWVQSLGGKGKLPRLAAEALVQKGILRREMKSFLFWSWPAYPELDSSAETDLKDRLATAMFGAGEVSPEDSVLIALAKQTQLLQRNFNKAQLKEHRKRIDEIAKGDALGASASVEAIKAVKAAVMVAVVMPAVAASTV